MSFGRDQNAQGPERDPSMAGESNTWQKVVSLNGVKIIRERPHERDVVEGIVLRVML